ncbi:MAG: hypothetical protein J4G10_05390 [Alphaproteobacteria bacterium]|nr:hypothetical protein [Alphaproteobacteria bacterium]
MAALATIATLGLNVLSAQQTARAQERQNLAQHAANDAAAQARIAELRRLGEVEELRREDALRQELAARRARFAGRGVSPTEGSAAAVLGGLAAESKQASLEDAYLRNAEIRDIQNARLSQGRINLLQAADAQARGRLRALQRGIPFSQSIGTSLLER